MIEFLPVWYQYGIVFLLGIIVGSFLNVVIYRFHTGKSINGNSHCLSCGKSLRWYELFPLLSYVFQRGHCSGCGAHIPSCYFLVELLTGLLFLLVYSLTTDFFLIPLYLVVVSVLIVIVVYDIYHMIILNEMVLVMIVLSVLYTGYEVFLTKDWNILLFSISSAALSSGVFGVLWLVSNGRWIGLGDVKLALPLGMFVGLSGVFSMVVLSFWIGAIISILILLVQYISNISKRGQIGLQIWGSHIKMKSEVPFAPFLIISFVLVFFYGVDVLTLMSYVIPSL